MSTLRTANIAHRAGSGSIIVPTGNKIVGTDGGSIYSPGSIVQVVQTLYTPTLAISGAAGYYAMTGLDTTITPKVSGSKFLVMYNVKMGSYQYSRRLILKINGTYQNTATTDANRSSSGSQYITATTGNFSDASYFEYTGNYLYQNSGTTPVAVSFEVYKQDTNPLYINRAYNYLDDARGQGSSNLIVMEVAT